MNHVVMFSGGLCSWAAAKRVAERYGPENLTLLFTDTLMEDKDLYRFLREGAANVGGKLVWLSEGRDPWEVFEDVRYLGNTRVDPCSKILKRDQTKKWLEANCDPANTVIYLGMDWTEGHRVESSTNRWLPWKVVCPMAEPSWGPLMDKEDMKLWLVREGIRLPFLYMVGAPHNNCGGFCVKAGQGHFKWLLETLPDRYAYHEAQEERLRSILGKDVAIMRDRRGGESKPLTMRQLRERLQGGDSCDVLDIGGCGCFENVDEVA